MGLFSVDFYDFKFFFVNKNKREWWMVLWPFLQIKAKLFGIRKHNLEHKLKNKKMKDPPPPPPPHPKKKKKNNRVLDLTFGHTLIVYVFLGK